MAFPVFCVFIGAPLIVFGFLFLRRRGRDQLEALRIKKEMLELEVEKEKLHLAAMAEENAKYDRIIEGPGARGGGA